MGFCFNMDQPFLQLGFGLADKLFIVLQGILSTEQINILRLSDSSYCHDDHELSNGSSYALAACDSGK